MDAANALFQRTILEPVLRLDHDMPQDRNLLPESLPDPVQDPSDRPLCPDLVLERLPYFHLFSSWKRDMWTTALQIKQSKCQIPLIKIERNFRRVDNW